MSSWITVNQWVRAGVIASVAIGTLACGGAAPPSDGMGAAAEVTATWSKTLNAGDAAALSAL